MSVAAMFAQRHQLPGAPHAHPHAHHHHPHMMSPSSMVPPGGRSCPALDVGLPLPASTTTATPSIHHTSRAPPRSASASSSSPSSPRSPTSAVTVRVADDTPANLTVGPYLFDLALGLHIADNKAPADVIQAHYRSGGLTVDGEPTPRWLAYMQAARDRHEQTVEAFRDPRGYIFYRTMRPIRAGQELLVWYGEQLARECGIPVLTPANIKGDQQYVCTMCNKSYKHPNCLKAHIRFRCAPTTRLDFLSSRSLTDSWLHLTPSPPRHSLEVPRRSLEVPRRYMETPHRSSPEVRLLSPASSRPAPSGPMNLKVGEGSAFKPPRRDSNEGTGEISRQSPDSTRDLRESPKPQQKERSAFLSSSPSPPSITAVDKRYGLSSPSKAVSLKDARSKFPLRSEVPACLPQPIQIFNHVSHPPAFPFPMDSQTALKYYYAPLYNKLTAASAAAAAGQMCYNRMLASAKPPHCVPNNYIDSTMYYHHAHPSFGPQKLAASPDGDQESHHKIEDSIKPATHMDPAPEGACLPFAFPLPSEKAGEPLDLLPRSLYMHKSRKGHLCIYCGKMYSRKYGLKIHLRTHTGYKPLKCKVCLRPFGDPSNLNKHIRLHAEGETPYRCEFCGKVLVRRRDLERHIKSRHPSQAERALGTDGEVSSSARPEELLDERDAMLLGPDSSVSSSESLDSLDGDEEQDLIDVEDGEDVGDLGSDDVRLSTEGIVGVGMCMDEEDDDVDITEEIEVVS